MKVHNQFPNTFVEITTLRKKTWIEIHEQDITWVFLRYNKIGAHKIGGQTQIYQLPNIDPVSVDYRNSMSLQGKC